ncbi:unnamed protein product [Calypogeia fissa]
MTTVLTGPGGRGLRLFATLSNSKVPPHLANASTKSSTTQGFSLRTARQRSGWKRSDIRAATSSTVFTDAPRVSQEELERIKAFRLPVTDFVPPYPYKRNKVAEKAAAEAYRWMEEYSLPEICPSPEEIHPVYKLDLNEYTMTLYVDCGVKEAAWLCKYVIWATFFDDRLDDIAYACSPEKSTALCLELHVTLMWSFPDDEHLYKNFVELLDLGEVSERSQRLNYLKSRLDEARLKPGTVYDTSATYFDALNKAFRDLWAELCEIMPADFLRRWALLFQKQNLADFTEITNRKCKIIPPVDEYIAFRRDSIGARIGAVLIEFADKGHLPDEIFDCSEMQRLITALTDFYFIHNDLCSFQKEAILGDVHNLVVVVSHAEDCSYTEAGAKIYQMMLDRITELEKAISDLERVTPPEYQHAVSRYFNFARNLVTGAHHWHGRSVRYAQYT